MAGLYVGILTIINSLPGGIFHARAGSDQWGAACDGYNYGAGAYERVRTSIRFSVAVTVGYAAAFWVVAMLFPGALIRIFNQEPEVIAAGVPAPAHLFLPVSSPCLSRWQGRESL